MEILGIDVGGSGIKGAIVNTNTGDLITERIRITTPQPANPENIGDTINKIVKEFSWKKNIGVGFPAVVKEGVIKTASNIDNSCINVNANHLFSEITDCDVKVINDADAAALSEVRFGVGKNVKGVVIVITVGTGIGTAILKDQKLIPNTELGHLYMKNGLIAEHYTSDAIRKKEDMKWDDWGNRFNEYLSLIEKLINPSLIIIGGGTSKKLHKFNKNITVETEVQAASFLNQAGIVGAAISAINI